MENGKMNFFGGDTAFSMAGAKTIDEATKEMAVESFNKETKKVEAAMRDKFEREIAEGKKVLAEAQDMEIVPMNSYILVRPYAKNPFEVIQEENGIITAGAWDHFAKNPDSGEEEKEYNISMQADVIEVGPDVKYIKPGDLVFYREACQVPVPFFNQGFHVVAEHQIHVVINKDVKKRFENLKNG